PSPPLSWRRVMPAAIDTIRCCGRRRGRNSARTPGIVCGLTARTITSLAARTLALSPPGRTPVSAAKASPAWGSGSLAGSRSGVVSPAASQPRARAAAILPAPTKPIRGTALITSSSPSLASGGWRASGFNPEAHGRPLLAPARRDQNKGEQDQNAEADVQILVDPLRPAVSAVHEEEMDQPTHERVGACLLPGQGAQL